MRISELAARGGVPVATVKYYLREGLLPPGTATSRTQARYDEQHLERLRLVRALLGAGGLSVAAASRVLAALDERPDSVHNLLGVASDATLGDRPAAPRSAHLRVHELLRRWGWAFDGKDCRAHEEVALALTALEDAGFEVAPEVLDTYAEHVRAIADAELAGVPTESLEAAVHYVVLGTVLIEPLLLALRRAAHEAASAARFAEL